jgi:hypothetical protein
LAVAIDIKLSPVVASIVCSLPLCSINLTFGIATLSTSQGVQGNFRPANDAHCAKYSNRFHRYLFCCLLTHSAKQNLIFRIPVAGGLLFANFVM